MKRWFPLRIVVLLALAAACDCESCLATHRSGANPVMRTTSAPATAPEPASAPSPSRTATTARPVVLPGKLLIPPDQVTRALMTPPPTSEPTPPPPAEPEPEELEEDLADAPAPRRGPAPMPPGMPPLKLPGGIGRPALRMPQLQLKLDPKSLHAPPP